MQVGAVGTCAPVDDVTAVLTSVATLAGFAAAVGLFAIYV